MKTTLLLITTFLFTAQNLRSQIPGCVGINTTNPQRTLHVHGTMRVDSLPLSIQIGQLASVVIDTAGNLLKAPIIPDSGDHAISLVYDDNITVGDLVAIGDGRSAYMSCNADGAFVSNETSDINRLVAQGFRTTSGTKSIRAVQISLPIVNGATHHFNFSVHSAISGVPSPTAISAHTETFIGTGTVTGWSLFVFEPPLSVLPNTDYYLVIQAYADVNSSRQVRTVSNSIGSGYLAVSTNGGSTWTTDPNRDAQVLIYEIRSSAGKVYRAEAVAIAETLRPDQQTVLATSGATVIKNHYDKSHNFIGIAKESGTRGETKKVLLGPLLFKNQVLIPGADYFLGAVPGSIITPMPAGGIFGVKVGFAADVNRVFITR